MKFEKNGYLAKGIYELTWEEFISEFSFSPRRKYLISGLEKVVKILKEANCECIFINGSFISDKLEPNDWDACFKDTYRMNDYLYNKYPELFDQYKCKEKYFGDLFQANAITDISTEIRFLDFFQRIKPSRRTKKTIEFKGIVSIKL